MCRWLAYCGEPLRPSELVFHPQHSLVAQSLDSPLGAETVNGDGFGFGWYPKDPGAGNVPGLFRSIEPAWNDQNLRELTQAVESPLFFSHVRAAAGPPIQQTNCHPFRFQNWLFMHNGALAGFSSVMATPGSVSEMSDRTRATEPTAPVARAAARSASWGVTRGGHLDVGGRDHRVGDEQALAAAPPDAGCSDLKLAGSQATASR